jgi:acyl dehydratase
MATLYWEDFRAGDVLAMGSHTFGEEEIIAFARQYDPQRFHIDPVAAKDSFFKGLIASGWHTVVIAMRLTVQSYLTRSASLGSPGVENVRWLAPVRPGDTISYRRVVLEARPSESKPGVGLVRSRVEAHNQSGQVVMTFEGWGMFGRRPAAGA